MGCGFSRERKNSASERSYLRRRSSAAACLSVFFGYLLFLPRHPRTASGIPAPVCSVRFAFPEASRPCAPDRLQAPAFLPANRAFRLHRRSLRPRHPEPPPVSRRPSAPSGSLFRMPPGPAAPIDRKRLFPARESCLPPAPPPSLAPAPPNRFRYPGARLFRPEQDGRERLRPSGKKCRGIRRSGRSAHPCGPRHGYSAPPVADGAFSVHRCFSISTNHSGQRHGRRVSLRMNPSTVDPVLSSSPRSFRIS